MADLGGIMGLTGLVAFFAALGFIIFLIAAGLYVYSALALSTIARKLKHDNPWLAWIPFANISLVLMLGGFHWALVFLALVPILGWIALAVLGIISMWRIYEKRNYPPWLSLVGLLSFIPFIGWLAAIGNLVILGLVAWSDRK